VAFLLFKGLSDAHIGDGQVKRQHPAAHAAAKAELKATASPCPLSPALLTANQAHIAEAGLKPDVAPSRRRDRKRAHGVRAPPAPAVRLLGKPEVCAIANATFPSIWSWMRAGKFPRSRIVNGRSMWLSTDIDAWIAGLQVRPLKGDAPSPAPEQQNQD
jgi:predicted DNA-binding transcriptional regulator AlpA